MTDWNAIAARSTFSGTPLAAGVGPSRLRTLALLFGDETTFAVTSTPVDQTKTYERFSDMARDMVEVRIYQGIHFRSADEVARRKGKRVADWAFSHFLRPRHRWHAAAAPPAP